MAKKVTKELKLQIPAGKANPAPPLGPALGQAGVNISAFVQDFNAKTAQMQGTVSILMTVYDDRSFDFVIKTPPTTSLLKAAAKVDKGSGKTGSKKAGSITNAQLREIAETKLPDLSANDVEAAMKIVAGSARSMGVDIKD